MSRITDPTDIDGIMGAIRARLDSALPPFDPPLADGGAAALARVQERLDRGAERAGGAMAQTGDGLARWESVRYRLPMKREYVVGELLAPSDISFIDTAYCVLLGRHPDLGGLGYWLDELRSGRITKVEILGELRWSDEGRAKGVHVDGLLLPYKLQKWKRRRWIGPLLSWGHAFVRLGSIYERQFKADVQHAHEDHELGRHHNEVVNEVTRLRKELTAFQRDHHRALPVIERLLMREDEANRTERYLAPMYAAFEDQFRGSRDLIRSRIEPYLAWVRAAGAGSLDAPVVDVGCGRGEWLELLTENGLEASGIDLNHDFIMSCERTGLQVTEGDAIEVLARRPAGSAGAITSMHLIEHLPFDRLVALIDECLRVLRPGGLLLLETPNPENLLVGSHYFYLDPTHRNPLPPTMMQWLVENRGFQDVRIERLSAHRHLDAPPLLPGELPGAVSINNLLEKLRVGPDYAIIARRP